jgi:hypothetical protein
MDNQTKRWGGGILFLCGSLTLASLTLDSTWLEFGAGAAMFFVGIGILIAHAA